MKDTYEECLIVGIEKDNDKKVVHFYGFGYYTEGDEENPYRFLEYTFFYMPLDEVLTMGVSEAEGEFGQEYTQYLTDCTRDEMENIYEHYDNGNKPTELKKEDLNMDTPLGIYILI